MIGPSKEAFIAGVKEIGKRQRQEREAAIEAEERQREQERQEREAAKEAKKKQREEIAAWQKRKREDEQLLLRKNGAFAIFKEAAKIMKKTIKYPSQQGPEVEITKPEFGEEPEEVHVRLCWGNCTGTRIDSPSGERYWSRQSNGVFCFVARENSEVKGLRLSGSKDKIIPLGNRELLTTRLLEKVTSDPIVEWRSFR